MGYLIGLSCMRPVSPCVPVGSRGSWPFHGRPNEGERLWGDF